MLINRRKFLKLTGIIGVTMGGTSLRALANDKPQLDESSAIAQAHKYVAKTAVEGQKCSNCAFVIGQSGEWLNCPLFQQHVVAAEGWCDKWVLNPQA